jgi:hypothetical protein
MGRQDTGTCYPTRRPGPRRFWRRRSATDLFLDPQITFAAETQPARADEKSARFATSAIGARVKLSQPECERSGDAGAWLPARQHTAGSTLREQSIG